MSIWRVVKTLEAEGGTRKVDLCVCEPDGELFRYDVNIWTEVYGEELLYHPDGGYWSCPEMSGYYDSLSECEKAAHLNLKWLN